MRATVITDGRGQKREAAPSLHTPHLGLRDRVSTGQGLALLAISLAVVLAGFFGVIVAFGCFLAWMLWWFFAGRQRAAEDLVAKGRCASCAYEMVGLPVEADGCAVCPECGAAWKVLEPVSG
jgi:hypothetical protein